MAVYYTYAYLRKDGTPYYIGKGKERRAWEKHQKGISVPKNPSRILVLKSSLSEEAAFRHEVYMIAILGRKDLGTGILHNKTDGGEGASGRVFSADTKKLLSSLKKGVPQPWVSERMKGDGNPMKNSEAVEKNREAQRKLRWFTNDEGKIFRSPESLDTSWKPGYLSEPGMNVFLNSIGIWDPKYEKNREGWIKKGGETTAVINKEKLSIPIIASLNEEQIYFKSISDASRELNIPTGNICKVLKGARKSAGGFSFSYQNEN